MPKTAKKILVVEDEKPMARALELKLAGAGFEVQACYNGQECIDLLAKGSFDLILLDLVMPVKDGFAVLADLKEKGSKVPVIVLTNLSQVDDYKRVKELGALDLFVKSDTPIAEIVEKVKKILAS
ncbi:MAG: response regulator [Candidatus Magasanikbacteria bacterium]|nr:response regulator [Candidatus Magasanikbacteria bacterium]